MLLCYWLLSISHKTIPMLRCHFSTPRIKISFNRNVTNTLNVNKLFLPFGIRPHWSSISHLKLLIIPTKFYSRETSSRESSVNNYNFLETCLSTPPKTGHGAWRARWVSQKCVVTLISIRNVGFLHFHTEKFTSHENVNFCKKPHMKAFVKNRILRVNCTF